MIKRLGKVLAACLLCWLCLPLPLSPAWADKVAEPMVFDANGGAIALLSLYQTDPATQADAVKSFYKTTKSFYKTIPGFYGLALFSSTDGSRVLELGQWQDRASYDAFQASLASGGGEDYAKYYEQYASSKGSKGGQGKAAVELGEPFFTAAFAIDRVVSPPGMVAAIPGSMALVQLSDLTTDTVEHQTDLMAAAQATLAELPQLYPAPRMAVLLSGIDTPHIALLANWGNTTEFSDLAQVPQLTLAMADDAAEPLPLTADTHLYQTIKVITPKGPPDGKG